jgi:hypothetical protein
LGAIIFQANIFPAFHSLPATNAAVLLLHLVSLFIQITHVLLLLLASRQQ